MNALGFVGFASFIMELCVEKTDLLCRTCLCFVVNEDYYNILEDMELFDKYAACTSLKVDPSDEYPKNICCSCYEQLTLFYDFKQMCCDTLGRFKDFLKSSTAEFLEKESALLQREIAYHTRTLNSNKSLSKCVKYHVSDKAKQNSLNSGHKIKDNSKYSNKTQVAEQKNTTEFKDKKNFANNRQKVIDKIDFDSTFEEIENGKTIYGLNIVAERQKLKKNMNLVNEDQSFGKYELSNNDSVQLNELTSNALEHVQQCVSSTQDDKKYCTELEQEEPILNNESLNNEIRLNCDNIEKETKNNTKQKLNFVQENNESGVHMNLSNTTEQVELVNTSQETHKSKGKKRVFLCKSCPKKFRKEERFQAHLRIHKGLKAYACTQCDKQFVRIITLQTHIEQHHSDTHVLHTCTYEGCTRVYNRKESLIKHIKEFHSHKTSTKNHMCEVCGKVFNRKMFLNRHRFVHMDTSSLPFECNECGRRFSKKLNLNYHLNRHAGIKNFICAHCGLQKTTKSELQTHMNYHTLEKTWKCETCGKIFNTLGNLKLHMRTVHEGLRDYICRYCNRRFGKAGTLKCHEMRHTGERPHKCKLCGHGFIQAVALRSHMKVHANMNEIIH